MSSQSSHGVKVVLNRQVAVCDLGLLGSRDLRPSSGRLSNESRISCQVAVPPGVGGLVGPCLGNTASRSGLEGGNLFRVPFFPGGPAI